MPTKGSQEFNTFVKGLITEASPLTFPEGASLDEINFKLLRDGSRERRLGINLEDDYQVYDSGLSSATLEGATQTTFHWPTPSGSNDVDIGVVQVGNRLYFLNLFTANPSANLLNGGSPVSAAIPNNVQLSFALINNDLVVVAPELETPFLLTYDDETDVVSTETSNIKIRDLYGVDDGLAVDSRPAALSATHHYNLLNQGWGANIQDTCGTNALACTRTTIGGYPSNSDTWTLGKIENLTSADVDKYDPNQLLRNSIDVGRAPRGHYIIDAFDRGSDRISQTGLSLPSADRELGRPSAVASYAGRLFYSGIRSRVVNGDRYSPRYSGTIFFSQIGTNKENLVKCYQEADPTSPVNSDLVDTDGGVIQIPEASNIVHMIPMNSSLFVFAENGIWEIRGDDGGFRATSFQINKVASVGVSSPKSIVEVNGAIFFWAGSGIYTITPKQADLGYDTVNITMASIQSLYNSLPGMVKRNAKGYFDLNSNTVRWLYYSDKDHYIGDPVSNAVELPSIKEIVIGTSTIEDSILCISLDVARVSDTSYFVAYTIPSSNHLYGVVVTINSDLSVTVGTPQVISAVATTSLNITAHDTNKVLLTYTSIPSVSAFARVITVSSSSFTAGAEQTLFATGGNFSQNQVEALSSTKAIMTYKPFPTPGEARILTISGDTVTHGSATAIGTSTGMGDLVKVSSTKLVFLYADGTGNQAVVLTVGASITVGTPLSLAAWGSSALALISIDVLPSLTTLSLASRNGTAELISTSLTLSGTTLTRDTGSEYVSSSVSVLNSVHHTVLGENKAVIIANNNNVSDRSPYMESTTVTGGSIINYLPSTVLSADQTNKITTVKITSELVAYIATENSTNKFVTQVLKVT